ncbi:CsgG/HfaB family protein [Aeoliella sp. ICT_H6.2]|uniref:CsgG/HfaB family protein n=1 Tax=Aeoliella straminimaris TaxID=2954799 RepID=A0A9X2JJV3_9BACT|nr:CsgG/HfaB family protein [Aeoliella straminimaris]MCO6048087.1 CsgG/HfaB family protein [Aeoliella straminimaris]
MTSKKTRWVLLLSAGLLLCPSWTQAQDADLNVGGTATEDLGFDLIDYPIAILPFSERGKEVQGLGNQVSDLLFANLIVDPDLLIVDREDLQKTLDEAELNLTGLVRQQEAIAIGHMTGAKLILTGSVMQIDNNIHIVAKIIGTETTRVRGAAVKGDAGADTSVLVEQLSQQLAEAIRQHANTLVAKPVAKEDRVAKLKQKLGNKDLPTVGIKIAERHVGRATIDPAAETEMVLFFSGAGFDVIDSQHLAKHEVDLMVEGEGLSEFASRQGNLTSVKARLEVKVIDPKTGKVVAIDRQTRVGVDNLELIAGKNALQLAAADIAERIIPKAANPDK